VRVLFFTDLTLAGLQERVNEELGRFVSGRVLDVRFYPKREGRGVHYAMILLK